MVFIFFIKTHLLTFFILGVNVFYIYGNSITAPSLEEPGNGLLQSRWPFVFLPLFICCPFTLCLCMAISDFKNFFYTFTYVSLCPACYITVPVQVSVSVCFSFSLSVCLSVCICFWMSKYPVVVFWLLPACLSVCKFLCMLIFVLVSVCLHFCVYVSVCLCTCISCML